MTEKKSRSERNKNSTKAGAGNRLMTLLVISGLISSLLLIGFAGNVQSVSSNTTLSDASGEVASVDISRDGNYYATGSYDNEAYIYENGSFGSPIASPPAGVIHGVAFSPNGSQLAICSAGGSPSSNYVKVVNTTTGDQVGDLVDSNGDDFNSIDWHGSYVAIAKDTGIVVWKTSSSNNPGQWSEVMNTSSETSDSFNDINFSPDGTFLAARNSSTSDEIVYNISSENKNYWNLTHTFDLAGDSTFTQNESHIIIPSRNENGIKSYNLSDGSEYVQKTTSTNYTSVDLHPTEDHLICGQSNSSYDIEVFNYPGMGLEETLSGHSDTVRDITSNWNGSRILSGASDNTAIVWNSTDLGLVDNTGPSVSDPEPVDGATDVSTNPTLSVEVNDPNGDSMDVTFYNGSDNSKLGEDNGVSSGDRATYSWAFLQSAAMKTWYVKVDDGTTNTTSITWLFTLNSEPEASNPDPSDGATVSQTTSKRLSVDVSDSNDATLNVTFYDNSDDSVIGFNSGISDGATTSSTWDGLTAGNTYNWYVMMDDDTNNVSSSTWSFTINQQPTISNPSPSDGATGVSTDPTLSVDVSDPDGDMMTVTFYNSTGSVIGMVESTGDGTASVTWSGLSAGTTYEWYATVNDAYDDVTTSTYSFTTESDSTSDTTDTTDTSTPDTDDTADEGLSAIDLAIPAIILILLGILFYMKGGSGFAPGGNKR